MLIYRLDVNDNASFISPKTQNRLKLSIPRASVVLTPPGLSLIQTFDLDLWRSVAVHHMSASRAFSYEELFLAVWPHRNWSERKIRRLLHRVFALAAKTQESSSFGNVYCAGKVDTFAHICATIFINTFQL